MACGMLAQKDQTVSRELMSQVRHDIVPMTTTQGDPKHPGITRTNFREVGAHEAVLFLQKEHELVLGGLHLEMKELQKKCDDLLFELHLRHVTSTGEMVLKKKLDETEQELKESSAQLKSLRNEMNYFEEYRQQQKWRELQLQQRVDTVEMHNSELKEDIARFSAQIRDLKIYNSALKSKGRQSAHSHIDSLGSVSPLPSLKTCEYSLESTESSGELSNTVLRESSAERRQNRFSRNFSRSSRVHSSPPASLSNRFSGRSAVSSRPPTGGVTLPPITQAEDIKRPHIRKQLRLLSAPLTNLTKYATEKKD